MRLIKHLFLGFLVLILVFGIGFYSFTTSIQPVTSANISSYELSIQRLGDAPIITSAMHPMLMKEADSIGYKNINGPSLIRVPEWLENPLGKYYLYFAHHKGDFIRLAYADTLTGPWTISNQKILPLAKSGLQTVAGEPTNLKTLRKFTSWSETMALIEVSSAYNKDYDARTSEKVVATKPTEPHLASPDLLIDHESQEIRMYYHGVVDGSLQMSKVARSKDGLNFSPEPEIITLPYLRTFAYRGQIFGLAMPGFLYRSDDGLNNFEVRKRWVFDTNSRHYGLFLDGTDLYIIYSMVGDAPEVLYYTMMDLSSKDWNDWMVEPPRELMRPETEWEGANLPVNPSMRGESGIAVNELRDPYIFQDDDGELYLLYTGMGEQNIGIAKVKLESN